MSTVKLSITRDDITPAIRRALSAGRDATPVMRSMGAVFKSMTEGTFTEHGAALRPHAWAPKKDGSPSTLRRSGLLWHSFHLTVTRNRAILANPTPYAAAHQFGYAKRNLPARPFYPVAENKLTPSAEALIAAAGKRAIQRLIG